MASLEKMYISSIEAPLEPGAEVLVYGEDQKSHQTSANFLCVSAIDKRTGVKTDITGYMGNCGLRGWYNPSRKTGELTLERDSD